jgi:hypothetical protein
LKFVFLILLSVCSQEVKAPAAIPTDPPPSAFLPPVGHSVHCRYSDTVTAPKGPESEAGRLTLTSVAGNKIQLTMAGNGTGSPSLEFQVDETGALHPASTLEPAAPPSGKRSHSDWNQQWVAAQALFVRLSVARRTGAHPGAIETSFPVQLRFSSNRPNLKRSSSTQTTLKQGSVHYSAARLANCRHKETQGRDSRGTPLCRRHTCNRYCWLGLQITGPGLEPQEARAQDTAITIKSSPDVRSALVGMRLTIKRRLPEATKTGTAKRALRFDISADPMTTWRFMRKQSDRF